MKIEVTDATIQAIETIEALHARAGVDHTRQEIIRHATALYIMALVGRVAFVTDGPDDTDLSGLLAYYEAEGSA